MPPPLFKKGKKSSLKSTHDEIWDDTLLIKAYEESVRLQKEEVAKQVAMKTNKKFTSEKEEDEESKVESDESTGSVAEEFKVGDFCRSTFAEDGTDYEAEIISINENGLCSIRYIGYGNDDRVRMENLVASWGPEAREEQKILSEADQHDSNQQVDHQEALHKFIVGKSQDFRNSLPIPPMPPMPPAMFNNSKDSEYMSAMLMSWYMSGYYTGLYHGRKQTRDEVQHQQSSSHSVRQAASTSDKETPSKKKKSRRSNN